MRRIKLILALATVMVATLVAFSGQALADDDVDRCRETDREFFGEDVISCRVDGDREFFVEADDFVGDDFFVNEDLENEFFFIDDEETFDEVCSPGLPDGIFISGCIFSDPIDDGNVFFDEDDHFNDRHFDHRGLNFVDFD